MVSPFCCMYSIAAASIWWPVEVKGPVSGRISPIFRACWADAGVPPVETVSAMTIAHSAVGRFIRALLFLGDLGYAAAGFGADTLFSITIIPAPVMDAGTK